MKLKLAHKILWILAAAPAPAICAAAQPELAPETNHAAGVGAKLPLPLPAPKAPVAIFRELLAMTDADRQRFLAPRPAEARQQILEKLREYESLSPEECELRLRVTELRYYLKPLMSMDPSNRVQQLELIPAELRPMIELRLRNWDQLPAEKQHELSEFEAVLRLPFGVAPVNAKPDPILQAKIAKWQDLAEDERERITERFEQYFGLKPSEQATVLRTLSEGERVQIEKTLQTFDNLEPAKRAQCIRALDKLCGLSPAERQDFLHNAQQWKNMSPAERKAWRNLVINLSRQPPYPPGFSNPPKPPLPRVPSAASAEGRQNIATDADH